jgi:hypothetical protein
VLLSLAHLDTKGNMESWMAEFREVLALKKERKEF